MQPDALKTGVFRDELPGPIEIMPGLFWIIAHDYVGADARQRREDGEGRGVEHDRFASGFAVRENDGLGPVGRERRPDLDLIFGHAHF